MMKKDGRIADGHNKEFKERAPYEPEHVDDPTAVARPDLNRAGYVGMADGIQSEGSTGEARKWLEFDTEDNDSDGLRIRNPGNRARYTRAYNAG